MADISDLPFVEKKHLQNYKSLGSGGNPIKKFSPKKSNLFKLDHGNNNNFSRLNFTLGLPLAQVTYLERNFAVYEE